MSNSIIWKHVLSAFDTAMGIDFDEFIAFYGPPLYIDVGRAA
jgi:hypothetical protein